MRTFPTTASCLLLCVGLVACSDDNGTENMFDDLSDGGAAGQGEIGGTGGGAATGGSSGTGGNSGAGGGSSAFGFDIRRPQTRQITCSNSPPGSTAGPVDLPDMDWLCTFADGDTQGHIYVRATPVDCTWLMSAVPIYETVLAQLSVGGQPCPLENAEYDWGGNHHNDSITFEYSGKTYEYNHSSFGWGWRACHPMDCMLVDDSSAVDDGCTMERTRPVICVQIQEDDTYDELVDTFEPCPGDPNYQ